MQPTEVINATKIAAQVTAHNEVYVRVMLFAYDLSTVYALLAHTSHNSFLSGSFLDSTDDAVKSRLCQSGRVRIFVSKSSIQYSLEDVSVNAIDSIYRRFGLVLRFVRTKEKIVV